MGRRRTKNPPPVLPSSSGELTLPVGAEAEVRNEDPSFLGSSYEVTITGHLVSTGRYTVVYSTLVDDDGGLLEETAAAANVRPRQPRELGRRRGFQVHEAVEAFHNEGWWAGFVSAVPSPPVVTGDGPMYKVTFPASRETMEFEETALRPHRVFQDGRWVPAAEVVSVLAFLHLFYKLRVVLYHLICAKGHCFRSHFSKCEKKELSWMAFHPPKK